MLPAEYAGNYVDLDRIQREAAQEGVTGQLARVINGQLPRITIEIGFPVDIVATRASAEGSGLVVVGRGRHELLARFLGGETAIGVLRRTRTPVLAVASDALWPPMIVVIATDFSPSATRAAALAVSLAGDGAIIHLVHVQAAADPVYIAGATALFCELEHRLRLPQGATVRTHLRDGDPADVLLRLASQAQAELIAMGTHSKGFVDRLTLGSVAEHVLRGASCSVLVAPDPVAHSS
jgi:nucleotide-binding universal stress UspA family protein